MIVKYLVKIALMLTLILTGCSYSPGGPSDEKIEEIVTISIEEGMDAFCPSPEIQSVDVIDRGSESERREVVLYPIRVEITKKCGSNMFSRGETKTQKLSYNFFENEYGEWKASKTSL